MSIRTHTMVKIVDDDQAMRESISDYCSRTGCDVQIYANGTDVLNDLDDRYKGVIICDLKMPGLSGMEVLERLQSRSSPPPLIMMTAHGDVPTAVKAIQQGAYDFIEKPFDPKLLRKMIGQAVKTRSLELDNTRLRRRLDEVSSLDQLLLGHSEAMSGLRQKIIDSANTEQNIMLVGEPGVEKEAVARAIHQYSGRLDRPFVSISCKLLETSQLAAVFSADDGAFFNVSNGTMFLDGVSHLSKQSQAELLKLIDTQVPVTNTGSHPEENSVRFISSSIAMPDSAAQFEIIDTLRTRLGSVTIRIPPLSARADDVFELLDSYLKQFSSQYQIEQPSLSPEDIVSLASYQWPGNIRQLRLIAEQWILLRQATATPLSQLIEKARHTGPDQASGPNGNLRVALQDFERQLLTQSLIESAGNINLVCERLSIPRRTLNEKLLKHGLSRARFLKD